jgi:hypothetical protein
MPEPDHTTESPDVQRPAYIYALIDPRDGEVRYVGKAIDPYVRLNSHLGEKNHRRKSRWLNVLVQQCLIPKVVVLECTNTGGWQAAERSWIKFYRSIGADLTIHTNGGEGLNGADAETREKLSRIQKARMKDPVYRAKIFMPEHAAKISLRLTGKKKSPEHVAKLKQNQKGRKLSEEHKQKISKGLIGNRFFLGHIHTAETRAKLAAKAKGNKSRIGQTQGRQERLRKSQATRDIHKTQEHRDRISESLKETWRQRQADGIKEFDKNRMEWPSTDWINEQLKTRTIKEVASLIGVKPGTLSAHLHRRKNGAPTMPGRSRGKPEHGSYP